MKVCFKRVIKAVRHGGSSRDVWLSYPMELPFVPQVGMEVCDGDWSCTVASLAYNDGWVFAFGEEIQPPSERTDEEIEGIVEDEILDGWLLSERILAV